MGTYYKAVHTISRGLAMTVIGIAKIHNFIGTHTDAKAWLSAWLVEAQNSIWKSPNDIKMRYKSASFLDGNRVIFNVKGNNYRMEIQVAYETSVVLVKRLGTHKDYDRWDL
jgi:mRNA interferase HigB